MKAKHDDLVEALDGMFDDHHGELARLLLDQIAFLDGRSPSWAPGAAELAAAMPAAWGIDADGTTGPDAGTGPDAPVLTAVDRLAEIPGVSVDLARAIIAETGLDMTPVPHRRPPGVLGRAVPLGPPVRPPHPGREEGPGRHLAARRPRPGRHRRRPHRHLPRRAVLAGIARRRGKAKAQVAVARSILVIIWHLLADPAARFTDLGHGYYQARTDTDRKLRNHIRQIQALGLRHHPHQGRLTHTALTRPDHRARPGSATARPFTWDYFPVSQRRPAVDHDYSRVLLSCLITNVIGP